MMNILRADLYRLFKQNSTWIILLVAVLLFAFLGGTIGFMTGDAPWLKRIFQQISTQLSAYSSEPSDYQQLEEVLEIVNSMKAGSIAQFIGLALSSDLMILITAFIAVFSSSAKRTGYIKNLYSEYPYPKFFFSQALILLFYSLILVLVAAVTMGVVSFFFFKSLPFGNPFSFALFLLMKALLVWTFGLLVMLLCDVTRKGTSGLIIAIVYISVGSGIIYQMLDAVIVSVFKIDFYIEYCTPLGSMTLLTYGDTKTYLAAAIVVVIYAAVVFLEEILFVRKKDII